MKKTESVTGIPTPSDFFLDVPLYELFSFDEDDNDHVQQARDVKYFRGTLDSYCPWCEKHSIFENTNKDISYDNHKCTSNQLFSVKLVCSRHKEHELFYVIKIQDNTIQKIGQYPSLADLQLQELKKYSKVLGNDRYRELTKAVGLSAHGVGVGSFVYLRRIFESLVEEAHKLYIEHEEWDDSKYLQSRMADKILMLKGALPDFLVEHTKLYSILSKGIHELTENECLKHFPVIKVGIELILDEKLEKMRKTEKMAAASKAIQAAGV